MVYEVEFTSDGLADFRALDARWRATVRAALETHLRLQPTNESRSRIKRLQDTDSPLFRLRVDNLRVYYDIEGSTVTVLGILSKELSTDWLREHSKKKGH